MSSGRATQQLSLAKLCAAYDALDRANGERAGGPDSDTSRAQALVGEVITAAETSDPQVAIWRARLLSRAVLNGWVPERLTAIAAAIDRDFGAME